MNEKPVFLRHEKATATLPDFLQNRGFHPWGWLRHAFDGGEGRRRPEEMDSQR